MNHDKIILLREENPIICENMIELFQTISEEDNIILEVTENVIKYKNKNNETIENKLGIINFSNQENEFKEAVINYRQTLRDSMGLLIKQGIKIDKTQTEKLAKQFEFLNKSDKK